MTQREAGRILAERLGLEVIGTEGHDLRTACVSCQSSDAGRIHSDTGVYFCYSCQKTLNAFDLCKVVTGDHETAKRLMVDVGLFDPPANGNGKANGQAADNSRQLAGINDSPDTAILDTIARKKGVTAAGFLAFGAEVQDKAVSFPMFGPDGEPCSTFTLTLDNGKGLYAKGKPVGVFLPTRKPQAGERWAIVEGVKDSAALHGLGYNAAGLPNNRLNPKFAPLFLGIDVVVIPDGDTAGQEGAEKTAEILRGVARSICIARLPVEVKESGGEDVRDVLRKFGESGPAMIRKAIEEAKPIADERVHLPTIEDVCDFCARELPLPPELIQGVLHRGSKLSEGGASKGYKTWALMDMGMSVAYGLPWLGCETASAKVLYVNLEIQAAFARRRFETLAEAKGIIQESGRLDVWNLRGYATSHMEIFPPILDRIADGGHGLIILDPIYKLYGGMDNENGAREMAALMNSIEYLAVQTGAAVAFGAHYSKGNQAAKDAIDRVSGSGVFARDPDSLLNFTRHREEDCYTVEATLRNFPPMSPFVVRWAYPLFTRDDSLNPAELKIPGKCKTDREARQQETLEADRKEIVNAAVRLKASETKAGLRDRVAIPHKRFPAAFASLIADGTLQPATVTKTNGQTYDGWKVRDNEEI